MDAQEDSDYEGSARAVKETDKAHDQPAIRKAGGVIQSSQKG